MYPVAVTCGMALRTPEDMPTSIRHTRPLHSQLAPPSCKEDHSNCQTRMLCIQIEPKCMKCR